jgi:hypothetical protein
MTCFCRRFGAQPVTRIITTIPTVQYEAMRQLIAARCSQAEFVRMAIEEKLMRESRNHQVDLSIGI